MLVLQQILLFTVFSKAETNIGFAKHQLKLNRLSIVKTVTCVTDCY